MFPPNSPVVYLYGRIFTGPNLQQDILAILLNFRLNAFVLTADIHMTYRQILVSPPFQDYERILWRFVPGNGVQDRNIWSFFCSLLGYSNLTTICDWWIYLLEKDSFQLRKLSSNEPLLLTNFPDDYLSLEPLSFNSESNESLKILGLEWNPVHSDFKYMPSMNPVSNTICCLISRFFDFLGILSPVTFMIRSRLYGVWSWTGIRVYPHPPNMRLWEPYLADIPALAILQIPLQVNENDSDTCEIHLFRRHLGEGMLCNSIL